MPPKASRERVGMARMTTVVFDAYGTLLDVHGAMHRHAARLPADWEQVSAAWRAKQLEYTWVRSLTGPAHHCSFREITREALAFVCRLHGIADAGLEADLMEAYRVLPAYPEAAATLARLRESGIGTVILSNGDRTMLEEGVAAAGIASLLDNLLSVETVGVFKPDPRVYRSAEERLGQPASAMAFVSANAWDAQAAAAYGFRVLWVNRTGRPDEYGLAGKALQIGDLAAIPAALAG
jgi:2-haloacid dehalogenase